MAGTLNAVNNTRPTADKESYLFHGYYFQQVTEDSAAGNNRGALWSWSLSRSLRVVWGQDLHGYEKWHCVRKGSWLDEDDTRKRFQAWPGFEMARRGVN